MPISETVGAGCQWLPVASVRDVFNSQNIDTHENKAIIFYFEHIVSQNSAETYLLLRNIANHQQILFDRQKGYTVCTYMVYRLVYNYERARSARSFLFNLGGKSEYERPAGRPW